MHKRLDTEFLRYLAASVVALAVDMGLLLSLSKVMHYMLAAVIAFLCGSITHYLLAVRLVFRTRRLADRAHTEGALFITAGILGLGVNAAIIYAAVEWLNSPLFAAKLMAAGASFFVGFAARKTLLFS